MRHTGSCHCGAVVVEVDAPSVLRAVECNCSICARTGFLHLLVPKEAFRLVRGAEVLTTYTFGTGVARHFFCRVCGCKPFYVPRSHPEGFSVNVRCLDSTTIERVEVQPFDGQRWEENIEALRGEK